MPLLPVFVAALLGAALDYASLWIARAAAKRERRAMEALFSSLRGSVVAYALALGFYVASDTALGAEGRNFETQAAGSLGIIGATIMASRLTTRFVEALGRRQGSYLPSASLFVSVANGSVIVVGMLSLLQFLQVPTTPILTVLATGGVVLALPLQSTVANLFGGIQIIAARQLQPGDYIKMDDGYEGFVSDITWRTTTIRDLSDNFIVVPNSKLASVVFTNYSQPEQRMTVAAPSLVSYRENLDSVEKIALEAAHSVLSDLRTRGDEEPYVRFEHLSEAGITVTTYFTVACFTDRFWARSLFYKRFCTRCADAGVALACQPWAEKMEFSPP